MRRLIRGLAWRLNAARSDMAMFGLGALKHRWSRVRGNHECTLRLSAVGPVTVRPFDSDVASFRGIFSERAYRFPTNAVEASVRTRYQQIVDSGRTPVIVDAGAYIGASALWFSSQFPAAHIVAIEPEQANFALLERNVTDRARATLVHAAVAAEAGHVAVVDTAESWATQVQRADSGTKAITLNEAFAMVADGEPFLAKVNIEGFEEELFSANLEWLDRVTILFIEPHDWLLPGRRTSSSFQRALGERDFHLFIVGPHLCYVRL